MTPEASSTSFELLDERIRRWIWSEGWTELRDVQEQAIRAVVDADKDVIIAAATAAGKTEAAFLPVLTNILRPGNENSLVVYISPLKALINDQFGRLEQLCEALGIAVWPWHGDISASSKSRFIKRPSGVLLITPESVEALFCNRGFAVARLFENVQYIVVDELHAFIGSERGKQLQSLMHRMQSSVDRVIPRIGLSATLGDMRLASEFLRPGSGDQVHVIDSKSGGGNLKVLLKGYVVPANDPLENDGEVPVPIEIEIAHHLFKALRGSNNLIFPNSRSAVEEYTYRLRGLCEAAGVPNEFWPHHGNLSREIREETEAALKQKERPANAICTNTLELGIDIGAVKSVAQIGPPPSVASLRQRLGRSGRRAGESAILRGYAVEQELTASSHLVDQLRENLFQFTAMVYLLLEGWFEPPKSGGMHLSTLVQQLLSVIAQKGGVSANAAYMLLCQNGPFSSVEKGEFIELLRSLGQKQLIVQESSGVLLHGKVGEALVNHYTFYAAFTSEEEYRLIAESRTLGSLPVSSAVSEGEFILFAGRTWLIEKIDEPAKAIYVSRTNAGRPPQFSSSGGAVHQKVREKMREVYESDKPIPFLDPAASRLIDEGRDAYRRAGLRDRWLVPTGASTLIFPWIGDAAASALVMMLRNENLLCEHLGIAIEVRGAAANPSRLAEVLHSLAASAVPTPETLLEGAQNLMVEKWDWALTDTQLMRSYASIHLDIAGVLQWLKACSINPRF